MKKIELLLALLLLGILTMGAVAGEDNATHDEVLQNDSDDYNYPYFRLYHDHVAQGEDLEFSISNFYDPVMKIDDTLVYSDYNYDREDADYIPGFIDTKGYGIGEHSLEVEFSPSDKRTIPFWIENIVVRAPDYVDLDYSENDFEVKLGSKDNFTITIDGTPTQYNSKYLKLNLNDLKFPTQDTVHMVTVEYKSYIKSFNFTADYTLIPKNRTYFYKIGDPSLRDFEYDFEGNDDFIIKNLVVAIDGKTFNVVQDFSRQYSFTVPNDLAIGNHTVTIMYKKDKKYFAKTVNATIMIVANPHIACVKYEDYYAPRDWNYGENRYVTLKLPDDAKGTLAVYDNGKLYKKTTITKGIAKISLSKLVPGIHNVTARFTGNYNIGESNATIQITERLYCNVPDKVVNGNGLITITGNAYTPNGKIYFTNVNSYDDYYVLKVKMVGDKLTVPMDMLPAGKYRVYVEFEGLHNTYKSNVINSKLTAKNLNQYYDSPKAFKVKVLDYKGKVVKSKAVKVYINGKYIKAVKTNRNGIASFKANKKPGKYKVTFRYGAVRITRMLNVKHILSMNEVKVNKSSDKLVLSATLKAGKTPLINRKITFNFNGMKFIAKTNKYGVAKVVINSKVLKKLKVDNKVKYQAIFLKDSVTKTAKVIM